MPNKKCNNRVSPFFGPVTDVYVFPGSIKVPSFGTQPYN